MSKVMRSVRNVTKGYSNTQVKVRDGRQSASENIVMRTADSLTQLPVTIHGVQPELR
jgi:hypothetical protein